MTDRDSLIDGGGSSVGAQHAPYVRRSLNVAPTDGSTKFNTIRIPLVPVACWKLNDPVFAFDSSFVSPNFHAELSTLGRIVAANKGCPMALFGHCDPAGSDSLNKTLGDRRAIAIYALLTRQPDLWASLHDHAAVGDEWDLHMVQTMLTCVQDSTDTSYYAGAVHGVRDAPTVDAVKRFQGDSGLAADGDPGSQTLKVLFGAYMDWLCTPGPVARAEDPSSSPSPATDAGATPPILRLQLSDFLGGAAAQSGDLPQMSLQSCGKFNPVVLLPQSEMNEADTTSRNADDAPNRRVVAFFFPKGTKVEPATWPCPKVKDANDACHAQAWPNGDQQRQNGPDLRLYRNTHDTMACRFYDRFARRSPCEKAQVAVIEFFVYRDGEDGLAAKETIDSNWGEQLRLGWMVSGKVKKASIQNTATGGTSDVTFAMGTALAGYTLGWVPLGVVPAAVDSNGLAEYHLLVQWAGGREYDECRVRVTMKGAAPDTPGYALAPLSQVEGAADMGLGVMRTPATGSNEGVWA